MTQHAFLEITDKPTREDKFGKLKVLEEEEEEEEEEETKALEVRIMRNSKT